MKKTKINKTVKASFLKLPKIKHRNNLLKDTREKTLQECVT